MGDKILENNLYLLEKNINASKLSFNQEVDFFEFVEIIGKMDISHLINYKKRDVFLQKLGEQIFIDSLLISIDEYNKLPVHKKVIYKIKRFYRNICEGKLLFYFSNKAVEYKIALNGLKRINYKKEFVKKKR